MLIYILETFLSELTLIDAHVWLSSTGEAQINISITIPDLTVALLYTSPFDSLCM